MDPNTNFLSNTLLRAFVVQMHLARSMHEAGTLRPEDAEAIAEEFAGLAAELDGATDNEPGTFAQALQIAARTLRSPPKT